MAMNLSEKVVPFYPDARPGAFQVGMEFQDFVCLEMATQCHILIQNMCSKLYQIQIGENLQGVEIKYDERCTGTNQLSIEVAEKSRNDPNLPWTPSGIMRDDNSWLYIQGNYDIIFVFAKNWLRRWHDKKAPEIIEWGGTIRRFFLPLPVAEKMAAKVIVPAERHQS